MTVCPFCKTVFLGQTGHLCHARGDTLVVVHPNGPKQPGQDAQAHADLAARNLELLLEVEELRNRRAPSPAVKALVEACKSILEKHAVDRLELFTAIAAVEKEIQ